MAKRKTRGKAKPLAFKAEGVARDIERLERFQKQRLQNPELIELREWAQKYVKDRLWNARDILGDVGCARQRIKHSDSKALRVLAAYWHRWDAQKLTWGERAMQMNKLGFTKFKDMSRSTFDRWRGRAAKLYPGTVSHF